METLSDTNDPIQNGYEFKFNHYLSRGWELFRKQPLMLIGIFVVFIILTMIMAFTVGLIPFVGSIVSNIIYAVLFAGFFIAINQIAKNKEPQFKDFFGGFNFFGPIAIYYIIYNLIALIAIAIPLFFLLWSVFPIAELIETVQQGSDPEAMMQDYFQSGEFIEKIPQMILPILAMIIISLYLSVIYMLTSPLIVLKKMNFWQAMETSRKTVHKKLISFILFIIVLGIINFIGVLFIGIGLLVTIPFTMTATYAIYEDLYGGESDPADELDVHVQ